MTITDNYTKASKNMDECYFDITGIPFVLNKSFIKNHYTELSIPMRQVPYNKIQKDLTEIKNQLKVMNGNGQRYLNTKQAAIFIGVSTSFLQKNMQGIFQEGKHYFYPSKDARMLRWDRNALETWMQGDVLSDDGSKLIDSLLEGLL